MRPALLAAGLIASVAVSCSTTSAPSHDQGAVLTIASDLPMSGIDSSNIVPLRSAIALAIADRGSVGGYPLAYEPFDDSLAGVWDPFKAEQNARIMADQASILGVIGPYNSAIAQVDIPVTGEADLVMISPSNTLDCLTFPVNPCDQRSSTVNNYFRIAATDSAQASAAARFAIRKLGVDRFAVLNDGSGYGQQLAGIFSRELTAEKGTVVFSATFAQNTTSDTTMLIAARKAGAEGVFVGGFFGSGTCKVRAGMAGVFPADAYMLAGDNITDPTCAAQAGDGANDHLLAMVASSQPPTSSQVYQEFRAHGIPPTTYVFGAYDCARILIDAIGRAIEANGGKLPSRRQVLDAVATTRDFVGATGTFTFQTNGDAVAPAISVYSLKGGQWTFWQDAS